MKKLYILSLAICLSICSFGQDRSEIRKTGIQILPQRQIAVLSGFETYYEQDFEDYTEGDMTFIDNDELTAHDNVAKYGSNWSVIDGVAYSNSWLIDGDQTSDDWMITPQITLGTDSKLLWEATALYSYYRDGYEIFISTSGNSISDFTTSLFSLPSENYGWTKRYLDLSAYDGQDVYLAFHHSNKNYYVLAVDNIFVGQQEGFDVSITSIEHNKYLEPDEEFSLSVSIENLNFDTLNSVTLNYQVDELSIQSFDIDSILDYGEEATFESPNTIQMADVGIHNLKVWISNLNGGVDDDNSNDTIDSYFYVIDSDFQKTVILEEYTGTWCGWCPGGAVVMEDLLSNYDKLIGICVHDDYPDDIMGTDETAEVISDIVSFFPGASVDRFKFEGSEIELGISEWEDKILERLDMAVPAEVDFTYTYDEETREITVDVSAEFALDMSEDFRFNCYVIEDSVINSDSEYDQTNYYSGFAGYEDHPYYDQANPVTNYVHRHVVREMLGGTWGEEASVSSDVVAGTSYTHQFTHTLSGDYNSDQVYLLVTIQEYNEDINYREIFNAKQLKLTEATAIAEGSIKLIDHNGENINDNDTVIVSGLPSDYEIDFTLSVKNVSSTTISVKAMKTVLEAVDGMTNTFCWAGSCYPDGITISSGTMDILSGFINTEFRGDLAPNGISGTQKMRYTFYNNDNVKEDISVVVFFNVEDSTNVSSLQKVDENTLTYGPNPISKNGVLNIDFSAMNDKPSTIRMYDNTSRLIFVEQVDGIYNENVEISLDQYKLSAGTYHVLINSNSTSEAIHIIVIE